MKIGEGWRENYTDAIKPLLRNTSGDINAT